ncbi:MliC family protein [Pseudomonas sp. NPDC007930]|uniref:MliC family protein n=1 Tax=Pseudomonas sp. NPDC007930 TaxID=3364417 RepID=UPI0036E7171E
MKGIAGLMCCAVLGGCAWLEPKEAAPAAPTQWVCDSQVSFQWRYLNAAQSAVQVRLGGSQQDYQLAAAPGAADGVLFTDGVLAFNKRGDEGLLYWVATNDLIGRGCKAR